MVRELLSNIPFVLLRKGGLPSEVLCYQNVWLITDTIKSSFKTININADSKKMEEEEDKQTREVQVEQGLKIFEEARRFEKIDKYEE